MSSGNHGEVLMRLAERLDDPTKARTAVQEIEAALVTVRNGGNASAAAYWEAQLQKARALLARLTGMPPGAPALHKDNFGRITMSLYVPKEETVDDWSRMITVQMFHGMKSDNPDTLAMALGKWWKTICPDGDAQKNKGGAENGYSFSIWMFTCSLNPQTKKPENMWLKVISGEDALYSVQYTHRRELSKEIIEQAREYLRYVVVCDTRRADRPCPSGVAGLRDETILTPLPSEFKVAFRGMLALQDENILTPLPSGFKVAFRTVKGQMTLSEYIPEQETVDDWSRMITVQIFHGMKRDNPDRLAIGLGKLWKSNCADGDAQKIGEGVENGYSFSLWMFTCHLNPNTKKPENMWFKVISGEDALYSVQYAYRKELSKELIGPAVEYLQRVAVCDTRRADRPCPSVSLGQWWPLPMRVLPH